MSALSKFSDEDLRDLYQDTNRGVRKNSRIDPDDTNSEGSWDANDYYRGHNQTYNEGTGLGHEDDNKLSELWGKATEGMESRRNIRDIHDDVRSEFHRRRMAKDKSFEDRLGALENAPKPEEKAAPVQQDDSPVERKEMPQIKAESIVAKSDDGKPKISGFEGSTYQPEGGTEAPGLAEYSKAKEKAQSFQAGSKPDYSFNAGSYGQKPAATDGVAGGSNSDAYGNVTTSDMDAEHNAEQLKNTHMAKVKQMQSVQ